MTLKRREQTSQATSRICGSGDTDRRASPVGVDLPRRRLRLAPVVLALLALAAVAFPVVAGAHGHHRHHPHSGKQPHSRGARVPDGVYRGTMQVAGASAGTRSAGVHIVHGKITEIDTIGIPSCFQVDPATGNPTELGGITSFKVRISPAIAVKPGKIVGVSAGTGPGGPPSSLPGPAVPLKNVIEATYPGGPGLPLTSATLAWFFSYSPKAANLGLTPPRKGHKILLGVGGFTVTFGDPADGGVTCGGVPGYARFLLGIPPIVISGGSSGRPRR